MLSMLWIVKGIYQQCVDNLVCCLASPRLPQRGEGNMPVSDKNMYFCYLRKLVTYCLN